MLLLNLVFPAVSSDLIIVQEAFCILYLQGYKCSCTDLNGYHCQVTLPLLPTTMSKVKQIEQYITADPPYFEHPKSAGCLWVLIQTASSSEKRETYSRSELHGSLAMTPENGMGASRKVFQI